VIIEALLVAVDFGKARQYLGDMQVKILGSGSSLGVPVIGCDCRVCSSSNAKNRRMRQSIFVQEGGTRILVDCGPDVRQQILSNDIEGVDGIFLTHAHNDHVGGLDEIRSFCLHWKKTTNLYMNELTYDDLKKKFSYILEMELDVDGKRLPVVSVNIIKPGQKYKVGEISFEVFDQDHANVKSLGFKFDNFAYSTDFYDIDSECLESLKGIDVWMVECFGYEKSVQKKAHIRLDRVLELIKGVGPKKAVLIHMSHEVDYSVLSKKLPKDIVLGYDGMDL
jgi:phosphoribosyl 1,2-cyclic phosphate phosphodiesterase